MNAQIRTFWSRNAEKGGNTVQLSPQSQDVLDRLQEGVGIKSGSVTIGPMIGPSKHLLNVFVEHHDQISNATGEQQAQLIRTLYSKEIEKSAKELDNDTGLATASQRAEPFSPANPKIPSNAMRWLLESLECQSIRGVAPFGAVWRFDFRGKSCLIYGPNGSGKSSMLCCITWILTGQVITDADAPEQEAKLFKRAHGDEKGSSICSWPVIVTLPDGDVTAETAICAATLVLKSPDGTKKLFLRRTTSGLMSSIDGVDWERVENLATFGIAPLDLHLSLLAPTVFGRQAIDTASDSRQILSLMLGYDALDSLGALASTAAGNRTRLATREEREIAISTAALRQKFADLREQLANGTSEHSLIDKLATMERPTLLEIQAAGEHVKAAVTERESRLAEILGLAGQDGGALPGLADQLTSAVIGLEHGLFHSFRTVSDLAAGTVLPQDDSGSSDERLVALENRLEVYLSMARERILKRSKWWTRERAEGARIKLLLHAAKCYDAATADCPVCQQSIENLEVKSQLEKLRSLDNELLQDGEAFFRGLREELRLIVSDPIASLAGLSPEQRIQRDWAAVNDELLGPLLAPIATVVQASIQSIIDSVNFSPPPNVALFPEDADEGFMTLAADFVAAVQQARTSLAILRWSVEHLPQINRSLDMAVTAAPSEAHESRSLLHILAQGKEAAGAVKPLSIVLKGLREAHESRKNLQNREHDIAVLSEIEEALEPLKQLSKYAASEVATVFGAIRTKTVENWKALYPETGSGLTPFSLSMGKGKDRSIEPLLAREKYVVQGQHFANAGLQRAIALSFYFALLEQHPTGLGFAILDDPILSLDEDHRESWSVHLLQPALARFQMVVGTHQRQYLNTCKHHFNQGHVVELNPRSRPERITWRPGDRLERAEAEINGNWTNAAPEMRKWREEVICTLDSYSPQRIFDAGNLKDSWDRYERLTAPHALAGATQRKIVATFKSREVTTVLDPGSHNKTEADVTLPMVRVCLQKLKERQKSVQHEFERLEEERVRALRGAVIAASAVDFADLADGSRWDHPISIRSFGRAAAKSSGCVVDTTDMEEDIVIPPGATVLVTSATLDPIAKIGQIVLLSPAEQRVNEGDLVAVTTAEGHHLLRRAWSDGNRWILQTVNPVEPQPCVVIGKTESAMRKVCGVIYNLPAHFGAISTGGANEWKPINASTTEAMKKLNAITVVGNSIEPIAKTGQKVLVGEKHEGGNNPLPKGTLAVVEIDDPNVGNVIKRVFPGNPDWLLDSVNPVDPHDPLSVTANDIRAVWPIRGVLFDITDSSTI